ncbi:hypothetical protein M0802_010477 [Mischocyttarus mexicanus]|nr:hypothetical protein M0802_010477 [Mischocyttarus mexicanus]
MRMARVLEEDAESSHHPPFVGGGPGQKDDDNNSVPLVKVAVQYYDGFLTPRRSVSTRIMLNKEITFSSSLLSSTIKKIIMRITRTSKRWRITWKLQEMDESYFLGLPDGMRAADRTARRLLEAEDHLSMCFPA